MCMHKLCVNRIKMILSYQYLLIVLCHIHFNSQKCLSTIILLHSLACKSSEEGALSGIASAWCL